MPIKGPSLFASKPISSPPPPISAESTGALASIFATKTETTGSCAFAGSGSGCGSNTIAIA